MEITDNQSKLLDAASMAFRVSKNKIMSRSRERRAVMARGALMQIQAMHLGYTRMELGDLFGRDQSTITYNVHKHWERTMDPLYADGYRKLASIINLTTE